MRNGKTTAAPRGLGGLVSVLLFVVALLIVPAESSAAIVGDPGPRSFQIDSSTLNLFPLGGSVVTATVGPVMTNVGADGSFTVTKDAFGWPDIEGTLPSANKVEGSGCNTVTVSHDDIARTAALGATSDATGVIDPATGAVQIGVDASLAPRDVTIPVDYTYQQGCVSSSGSTTYMCSIDPAPAHLALSGDHSDGTDPETGALHLSASGIASDPTTSSCSGGSALGDFNASTISWIKAQLDAQDPTNGTLDLMATISPGIHSPVPAGPLPAAPVPAPVPGANPATHRKCKKKHHRRAATAAKHRCKKKRKR
jgi:hypothetical protein